MIVKERKESDELKLFKSLNSRRSLSEKEKHYYYKLNKGFEGELEFDKRIRGFTEGWLFLNDLLLEHNNAFFQIDSLGICHNDVYLFDIKYHEGDFIVNGDTWQSTSGKVIKNPIHQLQRCESSLRRFLQDRSLNFSIKPYLIFNHPTFTLYQAPLDSSIVFPTQLTRFIENLRKIHGSIGARQQRLAEVLLSSHHEKYPNPFIPKYEYKELNKGIVCSECGSMSIVFKKQSRLICANCNCSEKLEAAILRGVEEFILLFPERKVNTTEIYQWCGGIVNKKTIQRILTRNFNRVDQGRASNYVVTPK